MIRTGCLMDSDASRFTFRDLKVGIWHSIPAGKDGNAFRRTWNSLLNALERRFKGVSSMPRAVRISTTTPSHWQSRHSLLGRATSSPPGDTISTYGLSAMVALRPTTTYPVKNEHLDSSRLS
jgi:hypothetical protein